MFHNYLIYSIKSIVFTLKKNRKQVKHIRTESEYIWMNHIFLAQNNEILPFKTAGSIIVLHTSENSTYFQVCWCYSFGSQWETLKNAATEYIERMIRILAKALLPTASTYLYCRRKQSRYFKSYSQPTVNFISFAKPRVIIQKLLK